MTTLESEHRSAALMSALAADDDAALGELITLWQAPLLRFVFRYVQCEADARELVHESFVRLHASRGSFRAGSGAFSGWIFAIAANLCRNHARWRRRHPAETLDDEHAATACAGAPPDLAAVASERVAAVRAAIAALPHDLKTTLLLFEYEELSYRQIAAVVGCSEKGVEARLSRARARLRESLAGYVFAGEPALAKRAGGLADSATETR